MTAEPFTQAILLELARLIAVITVDMEGPDATAAVAILGSSVSATTEAVTVFGLLVEICGRLMAQRSGSDLAGFRRELAVRGVSLSPQVRYQSDIEALRHHSAKVSESLEQYEAIEAQTGIPITIERESQAAVEAAAHTGSLLIVGEPGSGKSGVINALARSLRSKGHDVIELAVDRFSVETLEGLSRELQLEHGLLEVLEAWDGPNPGWLIIDALDATRGGKGEGVFRNLIERVIENSNRWRVIASIRSFDLRMGQQFRLLFKGTPPIEHLADPTFPNVRHIQVPKWSNAEFESLLNRAPTLRGAIEHAPSNLKDLAKVPFNTRLLSELIAQGVVSSSLNQISSQVELLRLFWQHRIESHGLAAKACLQVLVEAMVEARALRAPVLSPGADPAMIDTLSHEGVLIRVEGDRWIQFRHHLLFDFAAAQVYLDPTVLVSGTLRFPKEEARGLLLTPALSFVLKEIWDSEINHARFWTAVGHLVSDQEGDPIIRSASGRIGAELPRSPNDALWLAERIHACEDSAITTLTHVSGALAVRIEDDGTIELAPWANLVSALSPSAVQVAGTMRFLLHLLVGRIQDEPLRAGIGQASRALLAHGLSLGNPGSIVISAIDFVADTYGTNPDESRDLLARLFAPERLAEFGHEEMPTLCHKIATIGEMDPQFAARIFSVIYSFDIADNRQTRLGYSQILPLTSNARQDFDMARYSLSEYFPVFLEQHPEHAVEALIGSIEGYVGRQHSSMVAAEHRFTVEGRTVHLRQDNSYLWAHDPESSYSHDAELLVIKLLTRLRTASEPDAITLAELLREKASFAVLWSRLFMAAVERDDALVDELWSIASHEQFILLADTRKDAIDLVGKGVKRRTELERIHFEESAFQFDFSGYSRPQEVKADLLRRLFTAIGYQNLLTEAARATLTEGPEDSPVGNERPFVCRVTSTPVSPYSWIPDLDRENQSNTALIDSIEQCKSELGLGHGVEAIPGLDLNRVLTSLDRILGALALENTNSKLRISAEEVIGQGCALIINRKLLPLSSGENSTRHLVALLRHVSQSLGPAVDDGTEAEFERSAHWCSPSPRVDAAQSILDLVLQRPDLYIPMQPDIDMLLADSHPAVRLQAAVRLTNLWDIDREGLWRRLSERFSQEANMGVLDHLVSGTLPRLLHADPQRTLEAIHGLLARDLADPIRLKRLRKNIANLLAILWVTHVLEEAHKVLQQWIANPVEFTDELQRMLTGIQGAVVVGLDENSDEKSALRGRALRLIENIVDAANFELEAYYSRAEHTESEIAKARASADLVDKACRDLLFATGGIQAGNADHSTLTTEGLKHFINETGPILMRIGNHATPHTIYHLLQLLERLAPIEPGLVFDITAHALRGGKRTGFQFESMAMDQLVRLIGVFLADHKEIFETETRRARLIDSLEIFMEAGWPAARRLLYRLPELIQ